MTLANWIEEKCDLAREIALEEGFEEGLERGMEEGIQKGLQEGKIEGKVEMIHTKYRKGCNVVETAEMLELEEIFVKDIYQLFQTYPKENEKQIAVRYLQQITPE